MKVMRGPIDGRIDVGCGFLYSGYNSRPSLLSTYSPAYYITFVEKFGMKKVRDLLLYYIDLTKPIPKKLRRKSTTVCCIRGTRFVRLIGSVLRRN